MNSTNLNVKRNASVLQRLGYMNRKTAKSNIKENIIYPLTTEEDLKKQNIIKYLSLFDELDQIFFFLLDLNLIHL